MTALIGLAIPALGGWAIWRLLGGTTGVFSALRAWMVLRTLAGDNVALVLATMTIAGLTLDFSIATQSFGGGETPVNQIIITVALVGVVSMAVLPRLTLAVFALIGLMAQLILLTVGHGLLAGLTMLTLSFLMLIVLALVRGFIR